MNKIFIPMLGVAAAVVAPAFAADAWSTDLTASLKKAGEIGGYALVDFNGSDWCGPCIMLKSKVLSTPVFDKYAADNKLVLVDIDLPRGDKLSAEQKAANQKLANKYAVQGFPTIMVMTPEGIVVGGFSGGKASMDQVKPLLDAAIANGAKIKAAFAAANAVTDSIEKAKALYAIYQMVPKEFQSANVDLLAQAKSLDPNDSLGFVKKAEELKAKAEERKARVAAQRASLAQKFSGVQDETAALKVIEEVLLDEALEDEIKSEILMMKGNILLGQAESVEDIAAVKPILLEAAEKSPDADSMKARVEQVFADPAKLLENVKARKAAK